MRSYGSGPSFLRVVLISTFLDPLKAKTIPSDRMIIIMIKRPVT